MGYIDLNEARKLSVAFCSGGKTTVALEPREITFEELARMLSQTVVGQKDGPYYIRGGDLTEPKRGNDYLRSADLVILDGDSGFDPSTGEITNAPPMTEVTRVLDKLGLQYVAHTSYSFVPGQKWKYRVIIPAKLKHETDLKACVTYLMHRLHAEGVFLTDVEENTVWSQPWYLPRVPDITGEFSFKSVSSLKGSPLNVSECVAWYVMHDEQDAAEAKAMATEPARPSLAQILGQSSHSGPSIIEQFNADHGLDWMRQQLERHGYKFSHLDKKKKVYRYIRPGSETGIAGVMLFRGKHGDWCTYSHHGGGDPLAHRVCDPFEIYTTFQHNGDRKAAARSLMPEKVDRVQTMVESVAAITGQPPLPATTIRTSTFLDLLTDRTPQEQDYIEPDFLGPGNFCLIAGPPKAQKSFFLTEILVACATGGGFLSGRYKATRPLRVFYLQAEMNRKLLRKRAQMMTFLPPTQKELLGKNLVVTERFHMLLDEGGVALAARTILSVYPDGPDIIAIDPLANLFDGESEDRASEMMAFLTGRIEALRRAVNPEAGIIMVHHSAKKNAEDMNRDPFVAIRGSGALRGYYDTGVIIYRKSEEAPERKVFIECRNGESPEPMTVRLTERGIFEVQDTSMQGVSASMADVVLEEIRQAWVAGKPLSNAVQTRKEGRYIGRCMAAKHGLDANAVDALVEQWLMNGVVSVEVVDKHTKVRGLKVTGRINAEV